MTDLSIVLPPQFSQNPCVRLPPQFCTNPSSCSRSPIVLPPQSAGLKMQEPIARQAQIEFKPDPSQYVLGSHSIERTHP